MTPFPYQIAGAEFLASRKVALLADEPGLGKSLQAIRACDAVNASNVLIVCPASVVGNWRGEIAKFRQGNWSAYVTSFEAASGRDFDYLMGCRFDVLIIDEAHYAKSVTAKRTVALYGFTGEDGLETAPALVNRADAVWLLSGTPMPNNPAELYTHLRALAPERILSERTGKVWSIHQFVNGYCQTKHNGFSLQIVGARNEAKLHAKLDGFMLRRRQADVLKDLPEMRFGEVWLDGDLSALPPADVDMVRLALDKGGFDALKDIAGHVAVLRRMTGTAKLPGAIAWVKDWLASTEPTRKIVLFAHHKDVVAGIVKAFPSFAVIDGSKSQVQRDTAVKRFQTDPLARGFIGQNTAAGVGITLTAASDMLVLEPSWVPAENDQIVKRIHRIGQKASCLVRFAVIAGSIDEDIQRAALRKLRMIEKVIDGV